MPLKRLIYTAVFEDYDRVYPPVRAEAEVDYVIVTDRADLRVSGWDTLIADPADFPSAKAANLYHRALIHRILPGYDASLYVDGNIRLLGPTRPLFEQLEQSGAALAAYRHPHRATVAEEVDAVIRLRKVSDPSRVSNELREYTADGFSDDVPMIASGMILKDHRSPALDPAMELWWSLFRKHLTRDQLSFPYVVWKTGLPVHLLEGTFMKPNPFFALHAHVGAEGVNRHHAHAAARSHDSAFFKLVHQGWNFVRRVANLARRVGR